MSGLFKIAEIKIDGFSRHDAEPGDEIKIVQKWMGTSDELDFHIFGDDIIEILSSALKSKDLHYFMNRFLLVINIDNSADLYLQRFGAVVEVSPKRSFSAGDPVYIDDIDDIKTMTFPDVPIASDDRVIFVERRGWRFGMMFDFTRKIDTAELGKSCAALLQTLLLDDFLAKVRAELRKSNSSAFVICEGKTDWMHLERALDELDAGTKIELSRAQNDLGNAELLKICQRAPHCPHSPKPVICLFDADDPKIIRELTKDCEVRDRPWRAWGNNYFSLITPAPKLRQRYKNLSIEMLYPDEVISRVDSHGKRLWFDNELKREIVPGQPQRWIVIEPVQSLEQDKKIKGSDVEMIFDKSGNHVGLSKTAFAEKIRERLAPFESVNFSGFIPLIQSINEIIAFSSSSPHSETNRMTLFKLPRL